MRHAHAGLAVLFAAPFAAGCAAGPRPLAPLPVPAHAESVIVRHIAPGLTQYGFWSSRGPWAIQVLDVDRAACWRAVALKAGDQAVGRAPARALVQALADTSRRFVAGGINADFFNFEPPGVPVGAHVGNGRVISGPTGRPVIAFDSAGAPWTGVLQVSGWVRLGADSLPLGAWNQRRMPRLKLFDHHWGPMTDTASGLVEVAVGGNPARVLRVDTLTAGTAIPAEGIVLTVERFDSVPARRLMAVTPGTPVTWSVRLSPRVPLEAVGGRPIMVADSAVVTGMFLPNDTTFGPVRHPRTAVGIATGGRRLLLVTVDGRQPYSNGMTLPELAALFLELGARNAINLDGGGSTEFVTNRGGVMAIENRPSDPIERPVANALAVVQGRCGR